MTDNIVNLSDATGNATYRSPEQCLRDISDNLIGKHGAFKDGKKVLVLCLDDTKGEYSVSWSQAGMKMSECISLCTIMRQCFLREMKLTVFPEDL